VVTMVWVVIRFRLKVETSSMRSQTSINLNLRDLLAGRDLIMFFLIIIWIGVQFRILPPGSTAASVAYCALAARCLPRPQPAVVPLATKGGTMGEKWWPNGAWDMHPGFFYIPQICEMGR